MAWHETVIWIGGGRAGLLFPSSCHGVLAGNDWRTCTLAAWRPSSIVNCCAASCLRRVGQYRSETYQEFTINNARITDEQRIVLLANGCESLQHPDVDPSPVVKLFTPDAGATWLLTEIDPDDRDHAFGLYDLSQGIPKVGWVSLREIAALRGRLGLPIECDLSFRAEKGLSGYARRQIAPLNTNS